MANLKELDLDGVFPFASFEGAYYVLTAEPDAFDPRYERPVVSLFEDEGVYFLSLSRMLDTAIDWIEQGVHKPAGGSVEMEREMAIWQKHNPGVFEDE
jgi:hypothetical protein